MTNASTLLSEERFWQIIDSTVTPNCTLDEQYELLTTELSKLSEKELIGFRYQFAKQENISYRSDLWAVAYTVMGGCSDDGFDYFRAWLITRGKQVFDAAMASPDSLCDEFDKIVDGDMPEFEDIMYAANEVMEDKFGKDMYDEEVKYEWDLKQPDIELEWNEDDEESLSKMCPNTFKKWWDNPF